MTLANEISGPQGYHDRDLSWERNSISSAIEAYDDDGNSTAQRQLDLVALLVEEGITRLTQLTALSLQRVAQIDEFDANNFVPVDEDGHSLDHRFESRVKYIIERDVRCNRSYVKDRLLRTITLRWRRISHHKRHAVSLNSIKSSPEATVREWNTLELDTSSIDPNTEPNEQQYVLEHHDFTGIGTLPSTRRRRSSANSSLRTSLTEARSFLAMKSSKLARSDFPALEFEATHFECPICHSDQPYESASGECWK